MIDGRLKFRFTATSNLALMQGAIDAPDVLNTLIQENQLLSAPSRFLLNGKGVDIPLNYPRPKSSSHVRLTVRQSLEGVHSVRVNPC